MKKHIVSIVFACILSAAFSLFGCAVEQRHSGRAAGDAPITVVFTDRDVMMIRKYYEQSQFPPGLTMQRELFPEQRKPIQQGVPLSPVVQREALPDDLESKLSRLPYGYARYRIGPDIVLLEERIQLVVDVLRDIAP